MLKTDVLIRLQVEELETREVPATIFVVTGANTLLRFDSGSPGTITGTTTLRGLNPGETIQGIDFRPATGQLYGLGVAGAQARLLTIDTSTGNVSQVGSSFAVSGTAFGFDFNPTVDLIRLVSDADINRTINPASGAVVNQTNLNPGNPSVVGSAYTNNFPGAPTTTLYAIDFASDRLLIQNPPANGTLSDVGALGVDTSSLVGFDIAPGTGTAFASLTVAATARLFTINLANGAASQVATIGAGLGNVQGLAVVPDGVIVAGSDGGGLPTVAVFDAITGGPKFSFNAYDPGFRGGVRVAAADVNRDGVADIITGAGASGGPHVRVFDGRTGAQLPGLIGSFFAFDPGFQGGIFVAGGDINGDGFADVIVGADAGAGPHVRVFSGANGALLRSFFAYGPGFGGGVRVAAGDLNGDGRADIITGAGPSGGPHVKVFDGVSNAELASFFAYDPGFLGGIYVGAGDVNGDGIVDILTGPGAFASSNVKAFHGRTQATLASFFAFDPTFRGGARVGAADTDGDGRVDILVGAGPGAGPNVRSYALTSAMTPALIDSFFALDPNFRGGVFIGGGR